MLKSHVLDKVLGISISKVDRGQGIWLSIDHMIIKELFYMYVQELGTR